MKLYVLVQEAVYRHDILGVFDNEIQAIKAAKVANERESDGYHDIQVLEYDLNKVVEDGLLIGYVHRGCIDGKAEYIIEN